jgi:hypothetical protein
MNSYADAPQERAEIEMALAVAAVLGEPMACTIGGATSLSEFRAWCAGGALPADSAMAYALTFEVLGRLLSNVRPDTARAWFAGRNRRLGAAPALIIRACASDPDAWADVLETASDFLSDAR